MFKKNYKSAIKMTKAHNKITKTSSKIKIKNENKYYSSIQIIINNTD